MFCSSFGDTVCRAAYNQWAECLSRAVTKWPLDQNSLASRSVPTNQHIKTWCNQSVCWSNKTIKNSNLFLSVPVTLGYEKGTVWIQGKYILCFLSFVCVSVCVRACVHVCACVCGGGACAVSQCVCARMRAHVRACVWVGGGGEEPTPYPQRISTPIAPKKEREK